MIDETAEAPRPHYSKHVLVLDVAAFLIVPVVSVVLFFVAVHRGPIHGQPALLQRTQWLFRIIILGAALFASVILAHRIRHFRGLTLVPILAGIVGLAACIFALRIIPMLFVCLTE